MSLPGSPRRGRRSTFSSEPCAPRDRARRAGADGSRGPDARCEPATGPRRLRDVTAKVVPPERPDGTVHRGLALLVAGAFFMEILDGTVIAPAAPHIAADFGVPAVAINVAITAYVLTLAVLIPISGWLADRFGARRVFMAAVAMFTLASVGCAVAVDLPMLVGHPGAAGRRRRDDGAGRAARRAADHRQVRAGQGHRLPDLAGPARAGARPGAGRHAEHLRVLALDLRDQRSARAWPALLLARRLVPDVRAERRRPAGPARLRADRARGRRAGGRAGGHRGGRAGLGRRRRSGWSWPPPRSVPPSLYLLRAPRPLLDLRILRMPTYRVTAFGGSVFRAVITAIPFLLPLFFQLGFGWTAAQAGPGRDRAVRRQRGDQAGDHAR